MKKIDRFVIAVMVYWVLFIIVMIIIFCVKSMVPDTLIQYGLGGGAIELVCTALIEIMKERYERNNIHSDTSGGNGDSGNGSQVPGPVDPGEHRPPAI